MSLNVKDVSLFDFHCSIWANAPCLQRAVKHISSIYGYFSDFVLPFEGQGIEYKADRCVKEHLLPSSYLQ